MVQHTLRCLVVGAGSSGLAACEQATEAGIEVVCLEARQGVGGAWRYEDDPGRCDVHFDDEGWATVASPGCVTAFLLLLPKFPLNEGYSLLLSAARATNEAPLPRHRCTRVCEQTYRPRSCSFVTAPSLRQSFVPFFSLSLVSFPTDTAGIPCTGSLLHPRTSPVLPRGLCPPLPPPHPLQHPPRLSPPYPPLRLAPSPHSTKTLARFVPLDTGAGRPARDGDVRLRLRCERALCAAVYPLDGGAEVVGRRTTACEVVPRCEAVRAEGEDAARRSLRFPFCDFSLTSTLPAFAASTDRPRRWQLRLRVRHHPRTRLVHPHPAPILPLGPPSEDLPISPLASAARYPLGRAGCAGVFEGGQDEAAD